MASAISSQLRFFSPEKITGRSFSSRRHICSSEKGEKQVEVDREKVLEALERLDQQLESLAQKEVVPKKRPISSYSEMEAERDVRMRMRREELPEISGSFLAYSAGFLIILTIVNNLIFNLYVKPSVDGSDQLPSTTQETTFSQRSE